MGGKRKPDVSGWATRYNVTCADGLTLAPGAFARNDGGQVPVVFQHNHQSISNVLGHAEIMSSNEVRDKLGLVMSDDPRADELVNANINNQTSAARPSVARPYADPREES